MLFLCIRRQIRINKSAPIGLIVSALEIVYAKFLIIVITTVKHWIYGCEISYNGIIYHLINRITPAIITVINNRIAVFINDTDICSIIGNLWDNAIEGCERAYSNKKNILFKTYVNKTWFILELTNTSPDMMGTNLKTTKIGGSHGLGIKTIQKILDDHYSGIYEYTTTHSTFTAKVGLLMHPQKQIEESACRVFYWKS